MDDFDERIAAIQVKMKELSLLSTRKAAETMTLEQLREAVRLNREANDKEMLSLLEAVLKRREAVQAEIDTAEAKIAELMPVAEEFQVLMMEKMVREQMAEARKRKEEQAAVAAQQILNTPPENPKLTRTECLRKENERLRYELYCATHHQCGCKRGDSEVRQYECNDCYWYNND